MLVKDSDEEVGLHECVSSICSCVVCFLISNSLRENILVRHFEVSSCSLLTLLLWICLCVFLCSFLRVLVLMLSVSEKEYIAKKSFKVIYIS